jgi:hypothetical protein
VRALRIQRSLDLQRASGDVFHVKSLPLGSLFPLSLLCLASVGFASSAPPTPVSIGNNTYSLTVEASNAFHRDVDKLKSEATDRANEFCAQQGKQLKLISLTGKVPMFATGYARAKIVFMALNPGDPQLSMPVTPEGTVAQPAAYAPVAYAPAAPVAPPAPPHLTTDELYSELVKLDDLRKKGILNDDEFQAEKKKLLSRSN